MVCCSLCVRAGMLPKGAKYDLFRGAAPVAAIEDEKRPEKNVKVIKVCACLPAAALQSSRSHCMGCVVVFQFGKKSHAEVAKFSPDGQVCRSRNESTPLNLSMSCCLSWLCCLVVSGERQQRRFHRSVGL